MRLKDVENLKIGDIVCDCRYEHLAIKDITPFNPDGKIWDYDIVLEDGFHCSAVHCVEKINHSWDHPSKEEIEKMMGESVELH
jgi:hypothetical protein